jgi:hypothetical protein
VRLCDGSGSLWTYDFSGFDGLPGLFDYSPNFLVCRDRRVDFDGLIFEERIDGLSGLFDCVSTSSYVAVVASSRRL